MGEGGGGPCAQRRPPHAVPPTIPSNVPSAHPKRLSLGTMTGRRLPDNGVTPRSSAEAATTQGSRHKSRSLRAVPLPMAFAPNTIPWRGIFGDIVCGHDTSAQYPWPWRSWSRYLGALPSVMVFASTMTRRNTLGDSVHGHNTLTRYPHGRTGHGCGCAASGRRKQRGRGYEYNNWSAVQK